MLEVALALQRGGFHLALEARFQRGITGIFGPSGVGKTTLLHAILGRHRAERVICGNRTLADQGQGISVPTHQRKIAAVFQESRLFPHMSVVQNLEFALPKGDQARFDEVVTGLALQDLLTKSVQQLSGGEAQRIALGRALLARPEWLLLDEPLVSLDRGAQRMILKYLKWVHEAWQLPMLFVSHRLAELLYLTQDLLVLRQGGLLAHGRYPDILRSAEVLHAMHDLGLLNLLRLHVVEHRESEGITLLKLGSLTWSAPLCDQALGQPVELMLRPEDIALTPEPIPHISIQNQLRGTVRDIVVSRERALIYLDVGVELIIEVTPHAAHKLALAKGGVMYALFKAQALKHMN